MTGWLDLRPDSCSWCDGGPLVPIVFGMPDQVLMDQADRGEVALGGCVVSDHMPLFRCATCGAELGEIPGEDGDGVGGLEVVDVGRPWLRAVDAPFAVVEGDLPAVVHVPHAGLRIPGEVREHLLLDDRDLAEEQLAITDHLTDVLARPAFEAGANGMVNQLSRLVVDPERLPAGDEPMDEVGMGAVYERTTTGARLRHRAPARRRRLLAERFDPYAAAMHALVQQVLDRHDRCTIVDLHSYPEERLPYELGQRWRPGLCVGTDDRHTPPWLRDLVLDAAGAEGVDAFPDTPFAGTYVPLPLLGDPRVTSVMLEVRRDLYLEVGSGARWEPRDGLRWIRPDPAGMARVQRLVTAVVRGAATGRLSGRGAEGR